jgi:hypothetical protein
MATASEFADSLIYFAGELRKAIERNDIDDIHDTLDSMETDIFKLRALTPMTDDDED